MAILTAADFPLFIFLLISGSPVLSFLYFFSNSLIVSDPLHRWNTFGLTRKSTPSIPPSIITFLGYLVAKWFYRWISAFWRGSVIPYAISRIYGCFRQDYVILTYWSDNNCRRINASVSLTTIRRKNSAVLNPDIHLNFTQTNLLAGVSQNFYRPWNCTHHFLTSVSYDLTLVNGFARLLVICNRYFESTKGCSTSTRTLTVLEGGPVQCIWGT